MHIFWNLVCNLVGNWWQLRSTSQNTTPTTNLSDGIDYVEVYLPRHVMDWTVWHRCLFHCHGISLLRRHTVQKTCLALNASQEQRTQFCSALQALQEGKSTIVFRPRPARFWKRTGAVHSSGSVQVRPGFKAPRSKSSCNPAEDCIALHKYAIWTRLHGGCIGGGVDTIWAADRLRKPSPLVLAKLSWYLEKV